MDIMAALLYSGIVLFTFLDLDAGMEQVLHHLDRATRCFASGLLLADGERAQMTLYRSRPVDDLFLQAVQRRILSIYRVCAGRAVVEPDVEVTVIGEEIPGPYEPLRSLLAAPILRAGRVSGVVAIASVFPEAFGSRDLCTLSFVAAQASAELGRTRPLECSLPCRGPSPSCALAPGAGSSVWSQVNSYLASVCDLAAHWRTKSADDVPAALVQDLGSFADNARQIRELLAS
jgi:hypothetical protein